MSPTPHTEHTATQAAPAVNSERVVAPRAIVILHGPGRVSRATAGELGLRFTAAGWHARSMPSHANPALEVTDLVIGVDADRAACRLAVHRDAPVALADHAGHHLIDLILAGSSDLCQITSQVALLHTNQAPSIPITHHAVIAAAIPDTALQYRATAARHHVVEFANQIAVDIPDGPPPTPDGDHVRQNPRPIVLTTRTDEHANTILLQPDDTYLITAPGNTDVVIHADQHLHTRARRVEVAVHPTVLRILTSRTPRP